MTSSIPRSWPLVGAGALVALLALGVAGARWRAASRAAVLEPAWFTFAPEVAFEHGSAIDLRPLNEHFAGEHGSIGVAGGALVHTGTGERIRFWGVNGPPTVAECSDLPRCARLLARYGVNLVRIHTRPFDDRGDVDPAAVQRTIATVEAMKAEGIYAFLSPYYPLFLRPARGTPWLRGYDGRHHPFAALFFNREFQAQYRRWWTALLKTPSASTGRRLVEDPAVAFLEMVNQDSLLFWTVDHDLPDEQRRLLEERFAAWLLTRYGSLDAAVQAWGGSGRGDDVRGGRIALRPLGKVIRDRTPRDRDAVRFLVETQATFYRETYAFLRQLGFRGVIIASNWKTASAALLGPLEVLTYLEGDVIDRHAYFSCDAVGPESGWSIRDGQTYADRSALRLDPEKPSDRALAETPVMGAHFGEKPAVVSEISWPRPNRYRSEAPLYVAAYGSLQDLDAVVHFAFDGDRWSARPQRFMMPWTLLSPGMMGQFPAAALLFRRGLVAESTAASVWLDPDELLALRGAPECPRPSGDAPPIAPADVIALPLDPWVHLAGRVDVRFAARAAVRQGASAACRAPDPGGGRIRSVSGELDLDARKGILKIDAASAQGVLGNVAAAGLVHTRDLVIASSMDLLHVIVVSLDDLPIARSRRMLLQAMSEEKPAGFRTEPTSARGRRILDIGRDAWVARRIEGRVSFARPDADALRVLALDLNGYPARDLGTARSVTLDPTTPYYLVTADTKVVPRPHDAH